MSVIERIADQLGRRDEVPNRELAHDLAARRDIPGIQEIAQNLWNENENVANDCLKVLYEIGYLEPALIAGYVEDFLRLLKSKNNRAVWGSMLALSTVAALKAPEIYRHVPMIRRLMDGGSVITRDNGVKVLAIVASANAEYRREIFPYLLEHLRKCRPKDVPQHAESAALAVDAITKDDFIQVLRSRMVDMGAPQASRLWKLMRAVDKRA
jgi:hypothetical protein